MSTRSSMSHIGILMAAATLASPLFAQSAPQQPSASAHDDDLTAVRQAVESYVAAFNHADAEAVAGCWSKDAVFLMPSGERVQGQEDIAAYFTKYFADNPGTHLVVLLDSLRLVSADVAIEEGTALVEQPGEVASESKYLAIHRKHEGSWKLDTVRETEIADAEPSAGPLSALAWLEGTWNEASQPGVDVKSTYHWADGGRFLVHTFSVVVEGQVDLRGTQIIGLDPANETIRSWLFDSDGGFGEGTWSAGENEGDWDIANQSTLPDGRKASAQHHYSRVNDDAFIWSSTDRQVDGESVPDVEPISVQRELTVE